MPGSKRDFIPYYCTDFTGKEMRLRKSEKSHEVSLIIIFFFSELLCSLLSHSNVFRSKNGITPSYVLTVL